MCISLIKVAYVLFQTVTYLCAMFHSDSLSSFGDVHPKKKHLLQYLWDFGLIKYSFVHK